MIGCYFSKTKFKMKNNMVYDNGIKTKHHKL